MDTAGRVVIFVLLFVQVCAEFENCNRHVSFGYGYKEFFALTKEIMHSSENTTVSFEFYVKTPSDAHVLLTNEVTGNESIEIVIGGGSNTFSQIRMIRYGDRKTILTQRTENILSSSEYKKFDISIDRDDIIAVRLEENIFLNWKLTDLFPLKYVAFGSWTNTKAEWRFACDSEKVIDKFTIPPPPLKRLKSHLLYSYDPNALPVDPPNEVKIDVNLKLEYFYMNEESYFTIRGMALLEWKDNKLKWKPDDYDKIKDIFLPPLQIWTPYLTILDGPLSTNKPLLDMSASGVKVTYEGSLFWRSLFETTFYCYLNMTDWPNDSHDCTIRIGFQNEPENLVLTFKETNSKILKTDGVYQISAVKVSNGEGCVNGCGVISLRLENISRTRLTGLIAIFHIVIFYVTWFRCSHRIFLYLLVHIGFVCILFSTALEIPIFPRDTPMYLLKLIINVFAALIIPFFYGFWQQIPHGVTLPRWLRNVVCFLRMTQPNYNSMNRRNREPLFPLKKVCWFIFVAIHFSLFIYLCSL